jgi:MFS family permease
MRKPSVLVIFLTVFIDLIGFGIVVPLLPLYGKHLVPAVITPVWAQGLTIGAISSCFSAMQFIFSPIWGRLSDRHGRRPMLLMSTAGAAVSYFLFAVSSRLGQPVPALALLFASRMFAGICGGNITVAQAYIADITPPDQRSRRMGLIGMAFGLGFTFGPSIGSFSFKHLGDMGPGLVAGALCASNFLLALFVLTESLQPSSEHVAQRPHLAQVKHTLARPRVGLLVVVFFLSTFCFSCFEITLALLVGDNFHLPFGSSRSSAGIVGYLFFYCGLIGASVQGGLTGRLVKKMGEPKVIATSLILTAISLGILPFIKGNPLVSWRTLFHSDGSAWWFLLAALGLLAIGSSLTRPPLFGLLSNLTSAREQGATIGVAQSAGSLARILAPLFGTTVLLYVPAATYLTCTAILLVTTIIVAQKLCREPQPEVSGEAAPLAE